MADKPPLRKKLFLRIPTRLFLESTPEAETSQHVDEMEQDDRPTSPSAFMVEESLQDNICTLLDTADGFA
jgi:hypothetical protein